MLVGLLKRFAPFLITFAVGLFIASFFVTIAMPRFQFRRNRVMRQCQELQYYKNENQRLRQELENQQLKTNRLDYVTAPVSPSKLNDVDFNKLVPPPPPMAVKRTK